MYKVKVVSDVVMDMTSVDAILKQAIKPGMTDEQKCSALWQVVYQNRFWNPSSKCDPPQMNGTDPILSINCFAPTICQYDAAMCLALWAQAGLPGRMYQLEWHTTSEVFYGGKWRHFDATCGVTTNDDKGEITSVTERKPDTNGREWMRPTSYISHSEDYVIGQRMEFDLRKGECFTRYWGPLGKEADFWVPGSDGGRPVDRMHGDPNLPLGQESMLARAFKIKERRFEPMPADAAYANGRWTFEPDLASGRVSELACDSRNVQAGTVGGTGCLIPAKAGEEACVTFRVRSPYIMTGGWLTAAVTTGQKDSAKITISTDGGRTWQELWSSKSAGTENVKSALREAINGQFEYLARISMTAGGDTSSARLAKLKFETIVQANPFALPALKLGESAISVSAGEQLETMSILPAFDSGQYRKFIVAEQNVQTAREGNQASWVRGICAKESGKEGYLIFKVAAPGDLKRVRWGGRLAGNNDNNKFFYSLDGKNWQEQPWTYQQTSKDSPNPKRGQMADYETIDNLPAGTKEVYLKLWFVRAMRKTNDRARLHIGPGLRIDADYQPATAGAISPLAVTYCWNEFEGDKAVEKTHRQVIDKLPMDYKITVGGSKEPNMKYVKVEYAD